MGGKEWFDVISWTRATMSFCILYDPVSTNGSIMVSDAHLCYEPAQCLVVARIGVDVRANVADINFSESVVANQMSHAVRKSKS